MLHRIDLSYRINFETPFHIGTGFGFGKFIDSVTLKDSEGFLYIPGSSVKGKTRYFARRLARVMSLKVCEDEDHFCKDDKSCIICSIFGSQLRQGNFIFGDAKLLNRETFEETPRKEDTNLFKLSYQTNTRTGIKIDRRFRTVEEDYLFTQQVGFSGLAFQGNIVGEADNFIFAAIGVAPLEAIFLGCTLRLIDHLGRASSRGLGKCKVDVTSAHVDGNKVELIMSENLVEMEYHDLYKSEAQEPTCDIKG